MFSLNSLRRWLRASQPDSAASAKALEIEYVQFLKQHGLAPVGSESGEGGDLEELIDEAHNFLQDRAREDGTDHLDINDRINLAGTSSYVRGNLAFTRACGDRIEQAIRRTPYSLSRPVFPATFPTGTFNALAVPQPHGHLLLINDGSATLVYQVLTLLGHSISFAEFSEEGLPDNKTEIGVSPVGSDERTAILADILVEYALRRKVSPEREYAPIPSMAKIHVLAPIYEALLMYMLAHEYGHASLGHLESSRAAVSESQAGPIEVIPKSWEQEVEADLCGATFLIATTGAAESVERTKTLLVDSKEKEKEFLSVVAGVMLFFSLDDAISKIKARLSGLGEHPISETHPPSTTRAKCIREYLRGMGGDRVFTLSDAVCQVWDLMVDDIVGRVKVRR